MALRKNYGKIKLVIFADTTGFSTKNKAQDYLNRIVKGGLFGAEDTEVKQLWKPIKGKKVNLVSHEMKQRFEQMGSQEDNLNPVVLAKFVNPIGPGTWLATEYDSGTGIFFGYVSGLVPGCPECDEFGSFSQKELQELSLPFGLCIVPDFDFTEKPISELVPTLHHLVDKSLLENLSDEDHISYTDFEAFYKIAQQKDKKSRASFISIDGKMEFKNRKDAIKALKNHIDKHGIEHHIFSVLKFWKTNKSNKK